MLLLLADHPRAAGQRQNSHAGIQRNTCVEGLLGLDLLLAGGVAGLAGLAGCDGRRDSRCLDIAALLADLYLFAINGGRFTVGMLILAELLAADLAEGVVISSVSHEVTRSMSFAGGLGRRLHITAGSAVHSVILSGRSVPSMASLADLHTAPLAELPMVIGIGNIDMGSSGSVGSLNAVISLAAIANIAVLAGGLRADTVSSFISLSRTTCNGAGMIMGVLANSPLGIKLVSGELAVCRAALGAFSLLDAGGRTAGTIFFSGNHCAALANDTVGTIVVRVIGVLAGVLVGILLTLEGIRLGDFAADAAGLVVHSFGHAVASSLEGLVILHFLSELVRHLVRGDVGHDRVLTHIAPLGVALCALPVFDVAGCRAGSSLGFHMVDRTIVLAIDDSDGAGGGLAAVCGGHSDGGSTGVLGGNSTIRANSGHRSVAGLPGHVLVGGIVGSDGGGQLSGVVDSQSQSGLVQRNASDTLRNGNGSRGNLKLQIF